MIVAAVFTPPMMWSFVIVALFSQAKTCSVLNPLAYGQNHPDYKERKYSEKEIKDGIVHKVQSGYVPHEKSIHAEAMAIDKLPKRTSRKIIDVSLLVTRISRKTKSSDSCILGNSRPCIECIMKISDAIHKGYRITNIYYSDKLGEIVHKKLNDMLGEKQYTTKYYVTHKLPKKLQGFAIENPDRIGSKIV
jgi:hypothetical protein